MNHPVVMIPDGSDMPVDIPIPHLLGRIADMLDVAQLRNPHHPGLKKSPDHDLIVVGDRKRLVMTPDRFVKRPFPGTDVVGG